MLETFFAKHPVFSSLDYAQAFPDSNRLTARNLLAYHLGKGHIGRIRRGLFYVIPTGQSADNYPVDPFLVAARMTPDAVLCYHTALSFHGVAYSIRNEFTYFSAQAKCRPLVFQGVSFKAMDYPKAVIDSKKELMGVIEQDRQGLAISVTSVERTFVDVLDRIDASGGVEEVWRSLEAISYLVIDDVIKYALALKNSTTASKVGFFLARHQDKFMVAARDLKRLKRAIPSQPHYMQRRKRTGGIFVPDWNLIVPQSVAGKEWEEPDLADFT